MLPLFIISLLAHTVISFYVHNLSHQMMCFSKTLKGKPSMATFPEEFKLSDEFENNCDYAEINYNSRLKSVESKPAKTRITLTVLTFQTIS